LVGAAYLIYYVNKRKKTAEKIADELLNRDNKWQCVQCMVNEKSVIYLPCQHMALCQNCDQIMQNESNTCCICQRDIEQRIQASE